MATGMGLELLAVPRLVVCIDNKNPVSRRRTTSVGSLIKQTFETIEVQKGKGKGKGPASERFAATVRAWILPSASTDTARRSRLRTAPTDAAGVGTAVSARGSAVSA